MLPLGLLACGAVILVASSGAFDATNANRGVSVETANDEDAFLGIDYADDGAGDRTVTLAGSDSCSFLGCYYTETEVLRLEDDPADTHLNDPTVEFETTGDDLVTAFGGDFGPNRPETRSRKSVATSVVQPGVSPERRIRRDDSRDRNRR